MDMRTAAIFFSRNYGRFLEKDGGKVHTLVLYLLWLGISIQEIVAYQLV